MIVEEISLFDELEQVEREEQAQVAFQQLSLDEKERELRYCQNGLWVVYRQMLTFYQFPAYGITLSQACIDWKDRELRKHGDFKKSRDLYKEDFRKFTTYEEIGAKLSELKGIMNQGPYLYVTDYLERRIKRALIGT